MKLMLSFAIFMQSLLLIYNVQGQDFHDAAHSGTSYTIAGINITARYNCGGSYAYCYAASPAAFYSGYQLPDSVKLIFSPKVHRIRIRVNDMSSVDTVHVNINGTHYNVNGATFSSTNFACEEQIAMASSFGNICILPFTRYYNNISFNGYATCRY